MSTNNTDDASQAAEAEFILALETSFYEVAAGFVLWGLHIALACYAVHLLWKRGLRGSFARQSLSGIVLLMLAASTVYVILGMKFYVMQIPSAMGQEPPPALVRKLLEYNIASNWMSRLNFILSDLIVVWRAWALWPGSRPVRWILGTAMVVTTACTTANAIMITVDTLRAIDDVNANGPLYSKSALRALLYIPLLSTNVLATLLICYKAWAYRKDIHSFTTKSGSTEGSYHSSYKSTFQVDRVLALFIETGALYIVLMVINAVDAFGVFDSTAKGYSFGIVWSDVIMEISGIYPTVIIIFVSKYMSQQNAVYTSAKHDDGLSSGSGRPDSGKANRNGTLSTIRFDTPRLATTTSASIPLENIEHESSRKKEGVLEIV